MFIKNKKKELTPQQEKIKKLTDELKYCEKLMKNAENNFHMVTDEMLIEARIYEMKSLSKQQDYIISALKQLVYQAKDCNDVVNI